MADDASKNPNPFDVATINRLVALMSRHDLSEIDLRDGTARLRLRRGPRLVSAPVVTTTAAVAPASAPAAPPPSAAAAPPAAEPAKPTTSLIDIKAPTPGTFYAATSPGAEPYVRQGSRVEPKTIVCQIEAMKIFNEISADCSGVVAEILVENQQPVEYGQVLMRVNPT